MSEKKLDLIHLRLEWVLWGLTLLLLPLTSFRYLPFFGDSQVRPLSLIPNGLLLFLLLIRSIRQRKFLFGNSALPIILALILVFVLSSANGAYLAHPGLLNYTFIGRLLRAWVTLLVGLTFFLVPLVMVRSEDDLRFMMKWLFIGLMGHFVWGLVQWGAILAPEAMLGNMLLGNLIDLIQERFNMTGLTSTGRVSGLALEPSWLAAQMAILYLPWAFSSLMTRYSISKFRGVTVVVLMIILALSAMSYSRSGLIIIGVATLLTLMLTGRDVFWSSLHWFIQPFKKSRDIKPTLLPLLFRLSILSLFLVSLMGGGFILSRNHYFAALWQAEGANLVDYVVNIYAGPRLAYAWAGWNIFSSHPWLGVGLGASGFYFHSALPDWSHFNLPEVSQILSPDFTGFSNVKNLYIRLLAEGGFLAFWVWMAFNMFIFSRILKLLKSDIRYIRFTAVAGMFAFFSILLVNITLDSFAMPLLWLPFGVIVGIQEGIKPVPLAE